MFGENLLDKMKHISNPAVIKDKIQEKLHLDFNKEQQKGYIVGESSSQGQGSSWAIGSKGMPPDEDLPPVVQLTSPNLISIEVAMPAVKKNEHSNSTVDTRTFAEREANICDAGSGNVEDSNVGAQSNDPNKTDESSDFPVKLTNRPTGPASALARLQEEHIEEENSEPVYKFSQNTDNVPGRLDERPIFQNLDSTAEDDIVFTRKVKIKHKKKKTGML